MDGLMSTGERRRVIYALTSIPALTLAYLFLLLMDQEVSFMGVVGQGGGAAFGYFIFSLILFESFIKVAFFGSAGAVLTRGKTRGLLYNAKVYFKRRLLLVMLLYLLTTFIFIFSNVFLVSGLEMMQFSKPVFDYLITVILPFVQVVLTVIINLIDFYLLLFLIIEDDPVGMVLGRFLTIRQSPAIRSVSPYAIAFGVIWILRETGLQIGRHMLGDFDFTAYTIAIGLLILITEVMLIFCLLGAFDRYWRVKCEDLEIERVRWWERD
jgi:hypothetical protein